MRLPLSRLLVMILLAPGCAGTRAGVDLGRDQSAEQVGFPDGGRRDDTPRDRDGDRVADARADARRDGPCTPSCAGKACGGDGCGGSCGACAAWESCSAGSCVCQTPLPPGWPGAFAAAAYPLLVATKATSLQGQDNLYAPELHPLAGGFVLWYGGQGADGHDRIFVATSSDGVRFRKWPSDAAPLAALDHGSSNHVNDPSVVRVGNLWHMYYTDAPTGEDDRIWLATSTTLAGFQKLQQVLGPGAPGSWEAQKVGRPAVLLEGGVFKLWYDGQDGKARHVGYATSSDGKSFTRHPLNPIFKNAGAIDVKAVGGVYVMLREAGDGTYWATSVDGVHCWTDRGKLFGKSGQAYDAFGQVTPFLQLVAGKPVAVWFGGAQVATWNQNRIGVGTPAGAPLAGGGCTACTPAGWSCSAACQQAGLPAEGSCAAPGSANPGACCACQASGCEGCLGGAKDCHAACVGVGAVGGRCANPGSSNPGACCACW